MSAKPKTLSFGAEGVAVFKTLREIVLKVKKPPRNMAPTAANKQYAKGVAAACDAIVSAIDTLLAGGFEAK
jgi:hypothetical protein